jgi:hypothetical protein
MVTSSDDDAPRPEPDFSEWHTYQRWMATANQRVVIPYARCVAVQIPPVAVRLRRDWNAVRAVIRTHAIMHQMNRETDAQGRIVASLDDYEATRALVGDLVSEGISATVSATVRETVEHVRRIVDAQDQAAEAATDPDEIPLRGATVAEIARALNLERSAASRRLATARERGYLATVATATGKKAGGGSAGRYIPGEPLPEAVQVLPLRDTVCTGPCTHTREDVPAGHGCDCTGVCRCADVADPREGGEHKASGAPAPVHTCTVCGLPLDETLIALGCTTHGEDSAA